MLDDPRFAGGRPRSVTKLVLCSGKVYYDIAGHEERDEAAHIAVVRVEQLYPFPRGGAQRADGELPATSSAWCGCRRSRATWARGRSCAGGMAGILPERLDYDYVGRQLRAAPGEGYSAAHKREQSRIVRVALDLEGDRLEPDASARRPILRARRG